MLPQQQKTPVAPGKMSPEQHISYSGLYGEQPERRIFECCQSALASLFPNNSEKTDNNAYNSDKKLILCFIFIVTCKGFKISTMF